MKKNLEKLFNPQNIAIVGASEKEGSVGNTITRNLLDLGYQGEVFLINPKHDELLGKKCYKELNEIEMEIDLAIMVIPAAFVNDAIKKSERAKNFIVISAGFSEIGDEGKKREEELKKVAEEKEINILGPNCLGMIIPNLKLNASFAAGMPEDGSVALISQSGALIVAMLDMAKKEQIKFSQIFSVGNKMQIDEVDLMEYLASDEKTKVIALYLEGIKDGQKFIQAAQKISKPIIVLKAGRSEKSQKAIASHTGSLAGSDEIINAAFEKAGVIRAENLEDFFILIKIVSNYKKFINNECVIVTNAGGPGVLATDAFKDKNIKLKDFSNETKAKLREFLPAESSVENPIDVLGDADEERYQKTLEVLESEDAENIICIMTAQGQTPVGKIGQLIADWSVKSAKNIIPVFIGGEKIEEAVEILKKNNIANFEFPKELIDALDEISVCQSAGEIAEEKKSFLKKIFGGKKNEIIKKAIEKNRKALLFGEAGELMKSYSVPVVDFKNIVANESAEKLAIDFPVVLKVDSENVLHKTDKGGLILGIKNQEELEEKIIEMQKEFPGENLIVQPMVKFETELILGLKRDGSFGPVVVFGLGGIYTEVFKMVDFLILPVSREEIKNKIMKSKINFLFKETRGKVIGDIDEFIEVLFNFSRLVMDNEEIKEIDINPLLITKDGGFEAVDVKIIL